MCNYSSHGQKDMLCSFDFKHKTYLPYAIIKRYLSKLISFSRNYKKICLHWHCAGIFIFEILSELP